MHFAAPHTHIHTHNTCRPATASSSTSLSAVLNWKGGLFRKNNDNNNQPTPPPQLNGACLAKVQDYTRGACTAATLLTFLEKQATQDKSLTLDALVTAAAATIPNEARKALLLKTHTSLTTSTQAANMSKFSSSSSLSRSTSSTLTTSDANLLANKYRLLNPGSQGPRVSSGKSAVLDAVRTTGNTNNKTPTLKVKLSKNLPALSREADNIKILRATGNGARNSVIEVVDFLENYDKRGSHALVMEAGEEDLVSLVKRSGGGGGGGGLPRATIKKICASVLEVLGALDKKQLVWTDLRPSNLVMVKGKVKAIDLEGAVGVGEKPVDCTPEVTPPEVARLYVSGKLTQARVATSYDVWSFGVFVLFLATGGKQLFDGEAASRVMVSLASLTQEKVEAEVERLLPGPKEKKVAALVKKALAVDPARRPTVGALKREMLFF